MVTWDLTTGTPIGEPIAGGHIYEGKAVAAVLLPDGRSIAVTGGDDETVRVWDLGHRLADRCAPAAAPLTRAGRLPAGADRLIRHPDPHPHLGVAIDRLGPRRLEMLALGGLHHDRGSVEAELFVRVLEAVERTESGL